MECSECGNELEENAKFCSKCGTFPRRTALTMRKVYKPKTIASPCT